MEFIMFGKIIFVSLISVCALNVHADDVAGANLLSDTSTPLMGGYRTINPLDDGVQQAADFAVDQINKGDLVSILSSESQVVAGTNYKFTFLIAMADGSQHEFTAIVFTPLPNSGDAMELVEYQDQGVYATRN
jgi:hypothetical protein